MVVALIYLSLFIIAAALVVILIYGAKNAGARLAGESKLVLAAFALPVVLLIVFFAINQGNPEGAWTVAAIWTALLTTALALVALLVSGVKGLVS